MMQLKVYAKSKYDFVTDEGQNLKGAKIFVVDKPVKEENKEGIFFTPFAVTDEVYNSLKTIPGLYDIDFSLKVGSKGQMTVEKIKFVSEIKEI